MLNEHTRKETCRFCLNYSPIFWLFFSSLPVAQASYADSHILCCPPCGLLIGIYLPKQSCLLGSPNCPLFAGYQIRAILISRWSGSVIPTSEKTRENERQSPQWGWHHIIWSRWVVCLPCRPSDLRGLGTWGTGVPPRQHCHPESLWSYHQQVGPKLVYSPAGGAQAAQGGLRQSKGGEGGEEGRRGARTIERGHWASKTPPATARLLGLAISAPNCHPENVPPWN